MQHSPVLQCLCVCAVLHREDEEVNSRSRQLVSFHPRYSIAGRSAVDGGGGAAPVGADVPAEERSGTVFDEDVRLAGETRDFIGSWVDFLHIAAWDGGFFQSWLGSQAETDEDSFETPEDVWSDLCPVPNPFAAVAEEHHRYSVSEDGAGERRVEILEEAGTSSGGRGVVVAGSAGAATNTFLKGAPFVAASGPDSELAGWSLVGDEWSSSSGTSSGPLCSLSDFECAEPYVVGPLVSYFSSVFRAASAARLWDHGAAWNNWPTKGVVEPVLSHGIVPPTERSTPYDRVEYDYVPAPHESGFITIAPTLQQPYPKDPRLLSVGDDQQEPNTTNDTDPFDLVSRHSRISSTTVIAGFQSVEMLPETVNATELFWSDRYLDAKKRAIAAALFARGCRFATHYFGPYAMMPWDMSECNSLSAASLGFIRITRMEIIKRWKTEGSLPRPKKKYSNLCPEITPPTRKNMTEVRTLFEVGAKPTPRCWWRPWGESVVGKGVLLVFSGTTM